MNKMLRNLKKLIFTLILSLLVSCDTHKNSSVVLSCYLDTFGHAVASLDLPAGHAGLLSLYEPWDGELPRLKIVTQSGEVDLGVLPAGNSVVEVELIWTGVGVASRQPFVNHTGEVYECEIYVENSPVPQTPRPNVPPTVVSINLVDHNLYVDLNFDPSCPLTLTLYNSVTVESEVEVTLPGEVVFEDLALGSYVLVIANCHNDIIDTVEFEITPEDDIPCGPPYGHNKVLVCKNGRNILVPCHVALRWVDEGKAVEGGCR